MKNRGPLHVGMRNIKTALAVLICLVFYQLTGGEGNLLAAISAIICMQDSVEKSVSSGIHRLYGTAVGALLGMLFLYLEQLINEPYIRILMITVGITVLIVVCNLINRSNSIVIGGVVFLTIVLQKNPGDPFLYSIGRFFDTFLGILVAVLVNRFIRNPAGQKQDPPAGDGTTDTAQIEQTDTPQTEKQSGT